MALLFCSIFALGQRTLKVVDQATGLSLLGASVLFQGNEGTETGLTNKKGELDCSLFGKVEVKVNLLGYASEQVQLLDQGETLIKLLAHDVRLEDVVVTGQIVPGTSTESVHAIRVIDRERIEAQGAVSLRDILRQELNIQLQQDQVLGTGLSMNGLSGQQVKIMVDGVPVVGRLDGNLDLSQLVMGQVERIEVVEGPLSVNYGTDAFGGTINLITRKPKNDEWSGNVTSYMESIGQYNFEGSLSTSRGKNQLSLGGGRNFFAGYSAEDTGRFKSWKPKEQIFGNWNWTRNQGKWKLGIGGRYFDELILNRGSLRAPYFETAFDDYYHTTRIDHHFNASGPIASNWAADMVAGVNIYSRSKRSVLKDLTTLTETETAAENQDTTGFDQWMSRGTFNRQLAKDKVSLQLGYDFSYNKTQGKRINQRTRSILDLAGFYSIQYQPIVRLKIQVGTRWGYNSVYPPPLTPSLNLWYQTDSKWTFRSAYARGFRSPTLKELYLFFVDINHNIRGNEELRPEYGHHFSLSAQRTIAQSNGKVWKMQGKGWYNIVSNQIALALADPNINLYTYQNVEEFKGLGATLEGQLNTDALTLRAGGTINGVYYFLGEDAPTDIRFNPEFNMEAGYRWIKPGIQVSAFYKYTGRQTFLVLGTDGNPQEGFRDGFHTLDASVSKSLFKNKLDLRIGGKNLLNVIDIQSSFGNQGVHGSNASSIPVNWGRTGFVQLNLKL